MSHHVSKTQTNQGVDINMRVGWGDFAICLFLGMFGVHKFRERKIVIGILYLCTGGLFGIGWLVDSIRYFNAAITGGSIGTSAPIPLSLQDDEALPIIYESPVILQDGEACHYSSTVDRVTTKNKVVGYSGGSHGVSLRVCKGMSYRVGASKGVPIRQDVLEKNSGNLSITNKRIVFMSEKGSFDKSITKLSAIEPFQDGLALQFGAQKYTFMTNDGPYIYQIISRVINDEE